MLISFYTDSELLAQRGGQAPAATPINPNTYIKIHPDNTFTVVAKKEGGKWVYIVDHASANPAASPSPAP